MQAAEEMKEDKTIPPKLPLRFLSWFCPDYLYEEIEGDLIQKFNKDVKAAGEKRAKRRLLWNVIRFFRPGILLRNKSTMQASQCLMLSNYFKTSIRHIRRSKLNFGFKLGGLTLAIFSFLCIAIYVAYQISYDTHHYDYSNIYRVNSQRKNNGQVEKYAVVPLATGPLLKQYIPEIESFARIRYANGSYLRHEDKGTPCSGLIEADSTLFDILTFNFIEGKADALTIPNGIVLVEPIARQVFGSEKALGKLITINNEKKVYQVSAVIEEPHHTCLGFDAVILNQTESPLTSNSIQSPVEFVDQSAFLLVRLRNPVSSDLATKVESLLDRFIKKSDRQDLAFSLSFQPINEIFLGPSYNIEFLRKGNSTYVYAFSTLGILLLIVAGINYVNLSVAEFSGRSKETGVRKVLGARKYQLITHIALETLLFSLMALALGTGILYLLFPTIKGVLDESLRFEMLFNKNVLIIVFTGFAVLLSLSCFFPAKMFATSGVIQNLKSKNSGYNSSLSQILLFIQFSISAICISCAVMVGKQINFIHTKDVGFNKANLLMLNMPSEFTVKNMQTFKEELKRITGVVNVSNSNFFISGEYGSDWYFVEQEGKAEMKQVELYEVFSDDELFSTLEIKLIDGRSFDASIPSDSGAAFIINETAVKALGWKEPLGKRIYTHPEEKGKWDGTVVGIAPDINISPLYDKVKPLVMRLPWTNQYPDGFIYVRHTGDAQSIIKSIEKKYKVIMPGYPLNWFDVTMLYDRGHENETKAFTSLQFATMIIVLISILGICAMAMFLSVKRMKEFGIRKVLGASVMQISLLHIHYFVRLMLFACVIALPVAFLFMEEWLTAFAYRVELNYLPFLIVALASVGAVVLFAGYSAVKAGRMNPVDVIKSE